jgi:hypothetical protein
LINKKVTFFMIVSIYSIFALFACGKESYLIGEIEEVTREEIMLSIEENKSKIGETDRVVLIQKKLMDFTYFEKGEKVKVWIYDEEVRHFEPPQVPVRYIEVIK